MILYVIRHGEPDYTTDTLTERGKLQAEALGKRLGKIHFAKLFSSPLGRARQTAEPTARRLGMEVSLEPWASESLAWQDFHREIPDPEKPSTWVFEIANYKYHTPENRLRGDDWMNCDCLNDGGAGFEPVKGMERIRKSADQFLAKLGYERDGGLYRITRPNDDRVALFCHNGFGTLLLAHLLDIPQHLWWSEFRMSHTGVTILNYRNYPSGKTSPMVLAINDLSHLYAEGMDLPYEY